MIWIRADANKEIGSGHVMRCLSVAAALKKQGQRVCFLVADEGAVPLLRDRGQDYQILHTAYNDMEQELEQLTRLLGEYKRNLLLVDSYFTTEHYFREVSKVAKVVYMDDVPRFAYPVDGIINYNIYGDCLPYEEMAGKAALTGAAEAKRQRLYLGVAYAPLREQFQGIAYTVRPVVKDVLITTGGSDKYNLAGQILKEILSRQETAGFTYHVVSGAFNPHYDTLRKLSEAHKNIRLYQNVKDMAALMQQADIAITAGGSTMYELCAVGVPILCFSFVDNQELIVETFARKGLVSYGGNYLKEQETFAGNVAAALTELAASEELRQQYSRKERLLVDGCGAERIAAALCEKGTAWQETEGK